MRVQALVLAGAAAALASLLAACGGVPGMSHGSSHVSGATSDVTFAQQMIPHHAQALEMAELAATRASTPEVKALAAQITAAQDSEVGVMNAWLASWGASSSMPGMGPSGSAHAGHGMDMGDGMMSEDDMNALAAANGMAFDQMWLEMMVAHHEGAVVMARQILETSTNPVVTAFAQRIIDGQTVEIATMKKLLRA